MARTKKDLKFARIEPPPSLPPGAVTIWAGIVGALAADHFGPQDRHHLAAYCHAAWRHDKEMARDKKRMGTGDAGMIAASIAVMARLGPQLRLTVSSRINPSAAASSGRRAAVELKPAEATGAAGDWRSELH
jgi:phage terminase small subunit